MWSMLCAQYVLDYNMFFLFSILFYVFNIIVWRVAGCEFLWKVFIKSYLRNKNVGVAAGLFVAAFMVGFWMWQLIWYYGDSMVLGRYYTLVPCFDRWFVRCVYMFFLWVFALVMAVMETAFYNILWDNVGGKSWVFRGLAALFYAVYMFIWNGAEMQGDNAWAWMFVIAFLVLVTQFATHVVKDKLGIVAVLALRFGLIAAWLLNMHALKNQWFGKDKLPKNGAGTSTVCNQTPNGWNTHTCVTTLAGKKTTAYYDTIGYNNVRQFWACATESLFEWK